MERNPESKKPVRRLRWRRSQLRAMTLSALICLLSTLMVGGVTWWQGHQTMALQHESRTTHATITRRWIHFENRKPQYLIAYRYPELPADHPDAQKAVSPIWWSALSPGSDMAIQVNPSDPDVNGFAGNQSHLFNRWLWTFGAISAVIAATPLWLYLLTVVRKRKQLALLRTGLSATAEVTDVIETMQPQGKRQLWSYEVNYRFNTVEGKLYCGIHRETSDTPLSWNIGQAVTLFYDGSHPEHHALYSQLPGELVAS